MKNTKIALPFHEYFKELMAENGKDKISKLQAYGKLLSASFEPIELETIFCNIRKIDKKCSDCNEGCKCKYLRHEYVLEDIDGESYMTISFNDDYDHEVNLMCLSTWTDKGFEDSKPLRSKTIGDFISDCSRLSAVLYFNNGFLEKNA